MSENKIGEIIKKNRMLKDFSQADLAKAIHVAPSALAAYESGKRTPKIEVREQIAEVLNVDKVELSGLELTEDDEIRLMNKLLVKYCKAIELVENENGDKNVNVVLPDSFVPLQEKYQSYQDEMREIRENIMNASDAPLYMPNIRLDGMEMPDESDEAKMELDFWLDTWPEFDYLYQGRRQGIDPEVGGSRSLKAKLNNKQISRYDDYSSEIFAMMMEQYETQKKRKKKGNDDL